MRALPSVAGASVDRAFPHTLVIKVSAERPVAVARRGASSWLVTGSGKVIREIETGVLARIPDGSGSRSGAGIASEVASRQGSSRPRARSRRCRRPASRGG